MSTKMINKNASHDAETSTGSNDQERIISMSIYTSIPAYVYKLTCLPTGEFYYGFRKAHIKNNRLPEDDLLIYYFSSSNIVKNRIIEYGINNFLGEIIYQNIDILLTFWTEQQYIKNNWGDVLMMNRHFHDPTTNTKAFLTDQNRVLSRKTTAKTIAKIRETKIKNGTLHLSRTPESIDRAMKTKRRNGTINPTSPMSISKGVETKKKNGTLNTNTPAVIAKQLATKRKNGTLNVNTPESIAKKKITLMATLKATRGYEPPTKIKIKYDKICVCTHCNKRMTPGNFVRWHGNNCKYKI